MKLVPFTIAIAAAACANPDGAVDRPPDAAAARADALTAAPDALPTDPDSDADPDACILQQLRGNGAGLIASNWSYAELAVVVTCGGAPAAIDRVVHHATILEFDVTSYRTEDAKAAMKNAKADATASTNEDVQA